MFSGGVQGATALKSGFGLATDLQPESRRRHPDSARFAAIVKDLVRKSRESRWEAVRAAGLHEAFFLDRQYAIWDSTKKAVVDAPRNVVSAVPKLVLDFFKQDVHTIVSHLGAGKPRFVVESGVRDPLATDAAKMCEGILNHDQWERQRMAAVMGRFDLNLVLHCFAISKTTIDPKAGKYLGERQVDLIGPDGMPIQATGPVIVDDETGELAQMPLFHEGDPSKPIWLPEIDLQTGQPKTREFWEQAIKTEVVDFRDLHWDPNVLDFHDSRSYTEHARVNQQVAFDTWGHVVEKSSRIDDATAGDGYSTDTRHRGLREEAESSRDDFPLVDVYETYLMPGNYPYGNKPGQFIPVRTPLKLITTNAELLAAGELGDREDVPYAAAAFYMRPDNALGTGPVAALRNLQLATNKTASTIALAEQLTSHPQLMWPVDCKVRKDAVIRQSPGKIHFHKVPRWAPHLKPEWMRGPGASPSSFNFLEKLLQARHTASGQAEGGMAGGGIAGVETAATYRELNQRDLGKLTGPANLRRMVLAAIGNKTLHLIRTRLPEERAYSMVGSLRAPELRAFRGDLILESFQAKVSEASTTPQTEEMRMNRVAFLRQNLEFSREEALPYLGLELPEEVSQEEIDRSNAREENQELRESGNISTPEDVVRQDDPSTHLPEHRKEWASPRVRQDPEARAQLEAHMAIHEETAAEQQQQEMAMMAEQAALAQGAQAAQQPMSESPPAVPGAA